VNWSKYAGQYDTMVKYNPAYQQLLQRLMTVFQSFDLKSGSWVGDLGGGTGQFAIAFAQQNPHLQVLLVDLDTHSLDIAGKKARALGLSNLLVRHADLEHLEGYHFSAVNMMHILYVTRTGKDPEKPSRILRRAYESLEQGGHFVLTDIQKRLNMKAWSAYMFFNVIKKEGIRAFKLFRENAEVKKACQVIERNQINGHCIIQTLEDCVHMVKQAGFSSVVEYNNRYYAPGVFGGPIDHQVIARK
jgi:ubiquinone/menaquinone biosynthesis C-methylase UbiE